MKKLLFLSVPLMLIGAIALTNKSADANLVKKPDDIMLAPKLAQKTTMSGKGTEASPYIITTAAQFDQIQYDLSAYYKLGNNINFNKSNINPIPGTFEGVLDGNSKTLSNFKISKNYTTNVTDQNIGLFEKVGYQGNIHKLTIKDSTVETKQETTNNTLVFGGLICGMNYGTIENITCYRTTVNIENKIGLAGGISGYSDNLIKNCTLKGCKVFGSDIVGGISGSLDYNSRTLECFITRDQGSFIWEYTDPSVKLVDKNINNSFVAGGVAGHCYGRATIIGCSINYINFTVEGTLSHSPAMGYSIGHMNGGTVYGKNKNFMYNTRPEISSAYASYCFANYNYQVGKCENDAQVIF